MLISIHAPPRGATSGTAGKSFSTPFQFTPLREGRPAAPRRRAETRYFNSRPSARGDGMSAEAAQMGVISIHAPPRGATRAGRPGRRPENFNSRPSARGDGFRRTSHCAGMNFNSRPSARGDQKLEGVALWIKISIHAPPRGATRSSKVWRSGLRFQFTPLREGRRVSSCLSSSSVNFNSRPSARGDTVFQRLRFQRHISIHAPPRGATRFKYIVLR